MKKQEVEVSKDMDAAVLAHYVDIFFVISNKNRIFAR